MFTDNAVRYNGKLIDLTKRVAIIAKELKALNMPVPQIVLVPNIPEHQASPDAAEFA